MSLVVLTTKNHVSASYGVGPFQARRHREGFWLVNVPRIGTDIPFDDGEAARVPAHRAPDNAPDLDGFYTTTLGKHRKEGN